MRRRRPMFAGSQAARPCAGVGGGGAFTLIELLVVIAIIAILASLAIPALTSALERGKSAKDANNLRQLGVGMIQFVNQNEDTMWAVAGTNGGGTWPTTLNRSASTTVTVDWWAAKMRCDTGSQDR